MQYQTPCEIFIGKVSYNYGMDTAIGKVPIQQACYLSELGFEGDQCASTKVHGGVERAIHHYPREHYSELAKLYPEQPAFIDASAVQGSPLKKAGMGENISTLGLSEENVYIGDRYQLGEAILEVSQPRSACFKLNKRWGISELSSQVQQKNLCGWLYRVVKPGWVEADSDLVLLSRTSEPMSLAQVCNLFFHDPLNQLGLECLSTLEGLSAGWQKKAAQRLETGVVESWDMRLYGKRN